MSRLWLALFAGLLAFGPAKAQTTFTMPPPAGVTLGGVQVVSSCGGAALTNGNLAYLAMDTTGKLCTAASVSATVSGGFTVAAYGTPISVTTGGVTGTLPSGTIVVATNVGATNGAYCALGASATTSSQYLSPGGGWFAFTVGAATQLTCITSTSTTTVNMTGGSGLPTGTGGGGGGGSGGSVTQGTVPWADNISQFGGSAVTIGQQLAAASIPVILPSATITTLTPPTSVTVTQATGTNLHTVLDTTSTTAVTQATGTNLHTVVDSAVGLAQGSTTSGQTGSMIMGAVTTSPPTNTTAQTAYASLATTGGLRIAGDGTKLLVTPDSVALPANQSVNVAQFGGVSTSTGQVAVSTAPVTATNTALVVDLRPDSPGIIALGPAADTSSVPEVLSPTSSSTAAMSHASTTALGTSLVVKASAGNLYAFNCAAIAGGAAGNCIVYNGTTAPGTGALTGANVLDFCTFDTGAKGCSLSRIPMAINYSTGIVILLSSAASPYTYTTGTDTGAISADYK